MKFLSKKGFNPQNLTNQKRVWEAEQRKKHEAKKAADRERQLQRERDDQELARSRGEIPKLSFLYEQPPGSEKEKQDSEKQQQQQQQHCDNVDDSDGKPPPNDSKKVPSWLERQPGDDDAAAAFRRLLAGVTSNSTTTATNETNEESFSNTMAATPAAVSAGIPVLQGTTFDPMLERTKASSVSASTGAGGLSALEKAVGRRPHQGSSNSALTLDEQIQRFPALAHAPRADGLSSNNTNANHGGNSMGITFKPLGTQIRNVRCLACGTWGHSRGDRECLTSGWNPFASTTTASDAAVTRAPTTLDSSPQRNEDEIEHRRSRSSKHHSKETKKHRSSKKRKRRRRHSDGDDSDDFDDDSSSSSSSVSSDDESFKRRRQRRRDERRGSQRVVGIVVSRRPR